MIVRSRSGMAGIDGELAEAWKTLKQNVGGKVSTELDKLELGLTVAAYASLGALLFSAWAAWNTRKRG